MAGSSAGIMNFYPFDVSPEGCFDHQKIMDDGENGQTTTHLLSFSLPVRLYRFSAFAIVSNF